MDKFKHISAPNYALDVKSLFTIAVQGMLDHLGKRLEEIYYSSIEIKEILKLVHFLLSKQSLFSLIFFIPKLRDGNHYSPLLTDFPLFYFFILFYFLIVYFFNFLLY